MFIKCDELELFEFFESKPVIIGEETGDWIYTYQKNDFKIILLISMYEMYIKVSICYCDNIVYSEKYNDILEIKKIDSNTIKLLKNEKNIIIKKESQIGVIVEEN